MLVFEILAVLPLIAVFFFLFTLLVGDAAGKNAEETLVAVHRLVRLPGKWVHRGVVFMWALTTKRREVLSNSECFQFREEHVGLRAERAFWESAALIQSRCADSGHTIACVKCGKSASCSSDVNEIRCQMGPFASCVQPLVRIPDLLRYFDVEGLDYLLRALEHTESLEDVQEIFSPHPGLPFLNKGKKGILGFEYGDLKEPNNQFYFRCRELVKEEYADLPFVVQWGLVQNALEEQFSQQLAMAQQAMRSMEPKRVGGADISAQQIGSIVSGLG